MSRPQGPGIRVNAAAVIAPLDALSAMHTCGASTGAGPWNPKESAGDLDYTSGRSVPTAYLPRLPF